MASDTFSSRSVVMFVTSGQVKSVIWPWLRTTSAVIVPGRCRTFIAPPFGSVSPAMAVPSKYTFSMFTHPDKSTVFWSPVPSPAQFLISIVCRRVLLPRCSSFRLPFV